MFKELKTNGFNINIVMFCDNGGNITIMIYALIIMVCNTSDYMNIPNIYLYHRIVCLHYSCTIETNIMFYLKIKIHESTPEHLQSEMHRI